MKIGIKKIETFNITQTTQELIFEMDDFRNCTPAFIGKDHKDFMDYITNDIEEIKSFLIENNDILSDQTKKRLYLLDVDPIYEVIEDSRTQYEDSWFTMNKNVEVEEKNLVIGVKNKKVSK